MRGGCGKHPSWTLHTRDVVNAVPDTMLGLLGLELRDGIKNTLTANVPTVVPFVSVSRFVSALVPARFTVHAEGCQATPRSPAADSTEDNPARQSSKRCEA